MFPFRRQIILAVWVGSILLTTAAQGAIPPLKAEIISASGVTLGEAMIYPNYIELHDATGTLKGSIGVVQVQGRTRLFLIRADNERTFIGWSESNRLYNDKNQLVGYYFWTAIWGYVYDAEKKKVGQAQCLAYQGVCTAGVAGFLLGLL